jgi:hypothetical protein
MPAEGERQEGTELQPHSAKEKIEGSNDSEVGMKNNMSTER